MVISETVQVVELYRKTTVECITLLFKNSFTKAVAIQEERHLEVSARTVQRSLHEQGIYLRTPAIKHLLTDQHKTSRLLFAQQHVGKDMNFWGRVIFTDEKTFNLRHMARFTVGGEIIAGMRKSFITIC